MRKGVGGYKGQIKHILTIYYICILANWNEDMIMYIYIYIHALRINHEYICEQLFLKINSTSALN